MFPEQVTLRVVVSGCHFYCQNVVGDTNFSIDEWNKTYEEVKDKSEEIQRLVLDPPPPCKEQCFDCVAIVGARRKKTLELLSRTTKQKATVMTALQSSKKTYQL